MAFNVLGTALVPCSYDPLTGFFRDGCCHVHDEDPGMHAICARMTAEFLAFSVACGNDLVTPRPAYRFHGLKPGDRWCMSAQRWNDARAAGVAPPVILASTHERALDVVPLSTLHAHALQPVG